MKLIALMDVDLYEIDLRLLVLTMAGFSIRIDTVEGAILSMVAGLIFIHHGLWSWQMDLARSFRHGRCLFLAFRPLFSLSQILFVGLFSFVIGGGVVIGLDDSIKKKSIV